MNENIYYLSIQSTSLAHYLGRGLILPSKFYTNRPTDIQNIQSDYLIFSKKKFLNDSNCSIEIILENTEIKKIVSIGDTSIFLYPEPIPISRIKKVYFIDKIQKLKTIDAINRGAGFISENFIDIVDKEVYKVDIFHKQDYKYSTELEEKIKTYNHVLGGLAFTQYTLKGEYFENYFSILAHFNYYIQSKMNNRYDKYDGAFTHNGGFWSKLSPLLYEHISEKDVLNFAEQEKINIKKSNGLFQYETINDKSMTYKLAILMTYGEDSTKRKKTNDLISDCKNRKIPKEKQEGIALIYGINNGYSSFRNQYDKKIVKFKMNSLLDYYTVESIFQYVINDKKDNERFEYIDRTFPNKELILNISDNKEKEFFDIEKYLEDLLSYFKDNMFNLSPKELLLNILNKFKNTFSEEMNKKDIKINILNEKNKELEQQNRSLNQSIEDKNSNFDEEKEKIIIEETLESYLKYNIKKAPELKKIAKEKGIKYTNKPDTIKLILAHKNNKLL